MVIGLNKTDKRKLNDLANCAKTLKLMFLQGLPYGLFFKQKNIITTEINKLIDKRLKIFLRSKEKIFINHFSVKYLIFDKNTDLLIEKALNSLKELII